MSRFKFPRPSSAVVFKYVDYLLRYPHPLKTGALIVEHPIADVFEGPFW